MNRRAFITVLGGAAVGWPLAARAQQRAKLQTIGFLGPTTPDAWGQYVTVFVQKLHELGWIEDRTVAIEYRWAEGRSERFADIAAEFVRLKVDIIVTGGVAVPAAKQATLVIPIIFAVENDPVGAGLVASLARPGGNVTGLSVQSPDLVGKRIDLFARGAPRPAAVGHYGQCWLSCGPTGHARSSSGGPHTWPRCHPARNQARRGYRASLR